MFNKNSGLVQIWLRLIASKRYTFADVPNLFNLREIIAELLGIEA